MLSSINVSFFLKKIFMNAKPSWDNFFIQTNSIRSVYSDLLVVKYIQFHICLDLFRFHKYKSQNSQCIHHPVSKHSERNLSHSTQLNRTYDI